MDFQKLKKQWLAEENTFFQGWDFSHLKGRWQHDSLSWDYDNIVRSYRQKSDNLLDMGTGGGEFLLSLEHPYELTYVTEAYPPNVEHCEKVLAPLGITVKQVFDDNKLPFECGFFDIVINRHESFDVQEVHRILKPQGIFITQQVGSEQGIDLRRALMPDAPYQPANHQLSNNVKIVKSQGFEILMKGEEFPITRFYDIGAIVYYAKAIEWELPSFSVEKYFPQLCDMQRQIKEKGSIENQEHRFFIVARKG